MPSDVKGAEEARSRLPELLDAAAQRRATLITGRCAPVAVLAPFDNDRHGGLQQSAAHLRGSGRGLWGRDPGETLAALRNEWER
jgi:antitoxin (DNA-binding transcriptional repressor) of toxin-antitoxin stability system